ncbi:MAG: hypothetical protein IJ646_10085, partial [Clostridia bacterium]|nr:hypothetical protein [Clostridia bacterium]
MAACAVMLLCLSAHAEDLDIARQAGFDGLAGFAAEDGFDAWGTLKDLLTGEAGTPGQVMRKLWDDTREQLTGTFAALLKQLVLPVALCAGLRVLLGRNPAALGMSNLLCALACAVALTGEAASLRAVAEAFLDRLDGAAQVMAPVMVSVSTLTGATATASILTPLAAECVSLIDLVLRGAGMRLCAAACAVAVAGSLSARFTLYRLFALIKSAVRWLLTLSMFLFGGLMSVEGLIGAARDSAAIQTARLALENLVPVVGGDISGAAGSLAASAGAARQAVGLTGVLYVAHVCIQPMLTLAAGMLATKVIAAVLEPL